MPRAPKEKKKLPQPPGKIQNSGHKANFDLHASFFEDEIVESLGMIGLAAASERRQRRSLS